jgi:3-dehydroquinate synthase
VTAAGRPAAALPATPAPAPPVPAAALPATRIPVGGELPYEVIVGHSVMAELPSLIPAGAQTVAVVHAEGLGEIAGPACRVLADAGFTVRAEPVPDGEAAKDIAVATRLWSRLAEHRIARGDALVAVGGGAVTDLAGFTAATWLRGVRHVLVPTTLLAIADAAIGGKTGINIGAGKNLVGAFHPPAGVLADLAVLASLPVPEYRSGLAEVIKAGFIADPAILDLVEADPAGAAAPGGVAERELVERAVRMKAAVVSADLREAGPRETLNYGHTLGHAIERAEHYRMRHGEAVAIGMVFAAAVAVAAGRLDAATAQRHRRVLASVGLPVSYRPGAWPQLREAMAVDKKTRSSRLRLVVLDGLARPGILEDPPESLLERAYAEVSGP